MIAANLAQLALSKKPAEAIAAAQELSDGTEGWPPASPTIGRQEPEGQVSILELFNQHVAQVEGPATAGARDDGASGVCGQRGPGTEDASGTDGGGGTSTE